MRTVFAKSVKAIGFDHIAASRNPSILLRCLSTNSAIERGIRKSRGKVSRPDYNNSRGDREGFEKPRGAYNSDRSAVRRYNAGEENKERYPSRGRIRTGGFGEGPDDKFKRPSYQRRQDAGNTQQSYRPKDNGMTSNQGHFRQEARSESQAGRRIKHSDFLSSDQPKRTWEELSPAEQKEKKRFDHANRLQYDRADKLREEHLEQRLAAKFAQSSERSARGYGDSGSKPVPKWSAGDARPQNREQRRAAMFGHSSEQSAREYGDSGSKPVPKWSAGDARPRASDSDRFRARAEARSAIADPGEETEEIDNRSEYTVSRPTNFDNVKRIKIPLSVPYTTPASEFLYGTSVAIAALKSPRRKLYKMYIYQGDHRKAHSMDIMMKKLALARGLKVENVGSDGLSLLDKMSDGRPHNGYILEASPLPKLPATSLLPVGGRNCPLEIAIDHQSREEELINGTNTTIKYRTTFRRYPFILMLDGILDPGNLGAILRTAHFLSVDAVAISLKHSAPLSPVALKASAGASESLPLISIPHPGEFINLSQQAGWKFYAAVAPPADLPSDFTHKDKRNKKDEKRVFTGEKIPLHYTLSQLAASSPVNSAPCVLMLGAEGEGLRERLINKADGTVSIGGGWRLEGDSGPRVDSLNVSVAAGLLCEGFLRKPVDGRGGVEMENEEEAEAEAEDEGNVVGVEDEDEELGFGVRAA